MNANDFPFAGLAASTEALAGMPAFLEGALQAVDPADRRQRPGPEDFSLVEHACHLRDLEREGYLVRLRRVLAEERPTLEPFDGTAVAAARDYPSQDARAAARDFAAARGEALGILATLAPAHLAREAVFGGRPVCLANLIAMMVEHDRGHREEIERLLDSMEV